MVEEPSLRERKKIKARETLRNAALELFLQRGYGATSVADIVRSVDMSERTFFRYFPSKEEVLFEGIEDELKELRGALQLKRSETLYDSLCSAFQEYANSLELRYPDSAVLVGKLLVREPRLRARYAEIGWEWMEALSEDVAASDGFPQPTFGHKLVVSVAHTIFTMAYWQWIAEEAGRNLSAVVNEAFRELRRLLQ